MSVLVGGPQMNRLEQVTSDGHQVSLVTLAVVGVLMSDVRGGGQGQGACTVRSSASLVMEGQKLLSNCHRLA